jgi:hypothetical protein
LARGVAHFARLVEALVKLIVSALVSALAGALLGTIPVVNQHLHWNFFVIIPVSGVILGACFGFLQYRVARLLHARIGALAGAALALVGAVSYAATDFGTWATASVETSDGQTVALREVATFGDFMHERLSHSSISRRSRTVEVGSTATMVSFGVDLLGALLGTAAIVFGLAADAAYCQRCSRYRKDLQKLEREFPLDEAHAQSHWQELEQLAKAQQYAELAAKLQALPPLTVASRRKIEAQESACPKCGQPALALSTLRHEKEDWTSEGQSLTAESALGETPRLAS